MGFLGKTRMIDENFIHLAEIIGYSFTALIGFWKFCDKFFEYLAKRQKNYIEGLIEEKMKHTLQPIEDSIKSIKSDISRDNKFMTEQLQNIFNIISKK